MRCFKAIFLFCFLWAINQPGFSQNFDFPDSLIWDEAIRMGQLSNGLDYFILANKEPKQRAEFRLVLKVGSLQEDDDQLGIAHFVEHMAFNGTRHFAKNELIDFLERGGTRFGPDLNAYTSFDRTVYQLQVKTDSVKQLEDGLLILEDWASGLNFDPTEIDKERGVVISEWRSRLSARQRFQQAYYPRLYRGARLAERLPIGEPALIDSISYDRIKDFYEDWYRPNLMAIIVVGDFDPEWIEEEVVRRFSVLKNPAKARKKEKDSIVLEKRREDYIATDPDESFASMTLYNKLPKWPYAPTWEGLRRRIILRFYNRMLNERYFELAQSPDCPFSFASTDQGDFVAKKDAFSLSVTAEPELLEAGFSSILLENVRLAQHGFTESELSRMKAKFLESASTAYGEWDKRPSRSLADEMVGNYLSKWVHISPHDFMEALPRILASIELADFEPLLARGLESEDQFLIITAGDQQANALPNAENIWSLYDSLLQVTTEPFIDNTPSDDLLVKENLEPVAVHLLGHDSLLNISQYQLANGIKLWLKPTDFANDEILMNGFSPGGHSILSDSNYLMVNHLLSVLQLSGLADYDASALNKLLGAKQVSLSPYIQSYFEGFSGKSNQEDLTTMLQMVYAYAHAVRIDSTAYLAYRKRTEGLVSNMLDNPNYRFAQIRRDLLYDGHMRRAFNPKLEYDILNLPSLRQIYQDRFADFSDYNFVFVGNFSIDSLLDLATKYLGNLPNNRVEETWQDEGIRLTSERIDTSYTAGKSQRASVELIWHGDSHFSRDQRYIFSSLRKYLEIRLRETMREDQGEVYGVRISGNLDSIPANQYRLTISFQCREEAIDPLIQIIKTEIRKIDLGQIDAEIIQKIQAAQLKSYEEALRRNGFWLGQISNRLQRNIPFHSLYPGQYQQLVASLDIDKLQAAAQFFITNGQYLAIRKLPQPEP